MRVVGRSFRGGFVGSLWVLLLFGAGCASAPAQPAPPVTAPPLTAQVISEPPGLGVIFRGREVGPAPLELPLGRLEDAVLVTAKESLPPTTERRIRVVGPNRVEVLIRAGEPSAMAKRLGLSRVLVFDYGEAVTFEVDRADLSLDIQPLLSRQADQLKTSFAGIDIFVCGHTDSTGGNEHNQVLSLARAEAVATFLRSLGVEAARLKVQGFGPDYPVAGNDSVAGRALNRRTEIVLPDS